MKNGGGVLNDKSTVSAELYNVVFSYKYMCRDTFRNQQGKEISSSWEPSEPKKLRFLKLGFVLSLPE